MIIKQTNKTNQKKLAMNFGNLDGLPNRRKARIKENNQNQLFNNEKVIAWLS